MATSILAGLSQEATQEELLATAAYYLASILEKMPRLDTNDRMTVRVETIDSATLTAVSRLEGAGNRATDQSHQPYQISTAGVAHIYNNIIVSDGNSSGVSISI